MTVDTYTWELEGAVSLCLLVGMTLLYCQTGDENLSRTAGGVIENKGSYKSSCVPNTDGLELYPN